jgi:hypothetical protein
MSLRASGQALLLILSIGACSSEHDENPSSTLAAGGSGNSAGTGGPSPGGTGGMAGGAAGAGNGGVSGTPGDASAAGGTSGRVDSGGSSGSGGAAGGAGSAGASGTGGTGTETCCPAGDCLCRGPAPNGLISRNGPFATESFRISSGTVFHPTDAEAPFASIVMIAVAGSSAPELSAWGSFYASHAIVMLLVVGASSDQPPAHAMKLLEALKQLEAENTRSGSPLQGKLSDRFGVAGYSIAAGGTTLASSSAPKLKTSVTMAVWGGNGSGVQVPTLLLCGEGDATAPCSMSESVYDGIPATTPKMMVSIAGANHFSWFTPTAAGGGISAEAALAFQKVFLEGDERYRAFLVQSRGTVTTTIR